MALLEGKVALVTGGTRGIGEAIVRKFTQEGARVAFTYISSSSAERAQRLVAELGPNARAYQSDADCTMPRQKHSFKKSYAISAN